MSFGIKIEPKYDSRKSFYGKARVITESNGDKTLISYQTEVARIKNGKPEVYGTYSATTLRHIKEFLKQNGYKAENSKQIMTDYGVKAENSKSKEGLEYGEIDKEKSVNGKIKFKENVGDSVIES